MYTGPLIVPPGLVRFRFARGVPAALAKNELASNAAVSLPKNAEPCTLLVPDLRLTLTTPPSVLPVETSKDTVFTLNSDTTSAIGVQDWPPLLRASSRKVLLPPSMGNSVRL